MSIGKEEIDKFIDEADELFRYISSKWSESEAIKHVDTDFFLLYLYSHELTTQSKRLNFLTIVLAILTLVNLVMLIVSIFLC